MKFILILILLTLIPLSSAITTTMLPSYERGETIIIEIQGNILEPIERSDIIFRRAHVAIAVDYDIKRILDKYYLYAQAPLNSNNYTLFINNIATTVNGQNEVVNFNQTFTVLSNLTDYSISPGFVITNGDFSISIDSNLDQQTTINSDFPEENAITLSPGINNIEFQTSSKPTGFYLATVGKYQIPVHILSSQVSQEENISLIIYPKTFRETLKTGTPKAYKILITNSGQPVENLYFTYNQEIFSLDKELINLQANESVNLSITLKELSKNFSELIWIARGSDAIENISFQISFTQNDSQVTNSTNPEYYCLELGGKFCSALEICSGQSVQALDGSCCVGTCSIEEESSSSWIFYIFIAITLVVIILIFMRYKKTRLPKPKGLPINSVLRKPI